MSRKESTVTAKLPEGWKRRTFIITEEHSELLDRAKHHEDREIKEIIYMALEEYFKGKDYPPIKARKKPWEK